MGKDDGLKNIDKSDAPPPLEKGEIGRFLAETNAVQDHLSKPGKPKATGLVGGQVRPATLVEIANRMNAAEAMAEQLEDAVVAISDMLEGADRGKSDQAAKPVPASPLTRLDQASLAITNRLERVLDSVQTLSKTLFG